MDPFSVIVLALIYAALRAPGEAGRAVRADYRGRRDRWSSGWESRHGRRVAGYDRNGRAFNRGQRTGRRRGDPGWWCDPAAWRGREGRARVARGMRPPAIRAGIVAGALAYTAVFGLGVAARGFGRGLRGGYRLGKQHYRAKRNNAKEPSTTVTPGTAGQYAGPEAEVVDAVIVDDPNTAPPAGVAEPETGAETEEPEPAGAVVLELTETTEPSPVADPKNGPWLLTVYGPGVNRFNGADSDGIAVFDAADLDRRLAVIAGIPGLTAEVTPLPDPLADDRFEPAAEQAPDFDCSANGSRHFYQPTFDGEPRGGMNPCRHPSHKDAATEPRDPRPGTSPAGPTTNPGGTPMPDNVIGWTDVEPSSAPAPVAAHVVPLGAAINAPVLMEGANYHAHLHNLQVIAREAQHEYHSAELTLASASAARQRAEHSMVAVEQMAAGLAAQDFGQVHVGNMASLHELLARHLEHARTAERAAQESLATSEQLIEVCLATAAAFQRDHAQLAEAHAAAPHAAKTREAYQPM